MYHVSSINPFQSATTYSAGGLNDRFDTVTEALACARRYADARRWADVTPCGLEYVDGRTVASIIASGVTVAVIRDGMPVAYVWDEDAVAELDRANGDA